MICVISTFAKKYFRVTNTIGGTLNGSKGKPGMAALRNLEPLLRHVATLDHHRIDPSLLAALSLFLSPRLCPTNASAIHYSRWTASKQRYIAIYCAAPLQPRVQCSYKGMPCIVFSNQKQAKSPRFSTRGTINIYYRS